MDTFFYSIAEVKISMDGIGADLFNKHMKSYKNFIIDQPNHIDISIHIDKEKASLEGFELFQESAEAFFYLKQYKHEDGRRALWIDKDGRTATMIASADFTDIWTDVEVKDGISLYLLDQVVIFAFTARSIDFNIIKIHASCIRKEDKALLFLGVSGTGKSTHSANWLKYVEGANLLNDDDPLIKIEENGKVYVYGAPWSGKTPCYINERAELKAMVHLFQAPYNELRKQNIKESLDSMATSTFDLPLYDGFRDRGFMLNLSLLERIPMYRLMNLPDRAAVSLTETLLNNINL